jgi:hypothetical protein
MPNSLYNMIQGNMPQNQFNSFMQNPFSFLANKQINIPIQFQNDPQQAIQYLLNTGRMNPQAFNRIYNTLQQMGMRF